MSENIPPQEPLQEELPGYPVVEHEEISKTEAMAGVFTSPTDTFNSIAATPKKNYWLMPVLVCIALGMISTFLFMGDAELTSKTMDKQREAVRKQFDEKVKDGSMTREQADQSLEQSEKFMDPNSVFFKLMGYAGTIVGPFIVLLILSLLYFIILKIMKIAPDFINIMNVVGLAMLITGLGNLIGVVISILKGELTGAGLGLAFSEATVGPKVYGLITKIDIFNIWYYVVVGLGLAAITKMEKSKAIPVAFIPFILYLFITFLFA